MFHFHSLDPVDPEAAFCAAYDVGDDVHIVVSHTGKRLLVCHADEQGELDVEALMVTCLERVDGVCCCFPNAVRAFYPQLSAPVVGDWEGETATRFSAMGKLEWGPEPVIRARHQSGM